MTFLAEITDEMNPEEFVEAPARPLKRPPRTSETEAMMAIETRTSISVNPPDLPRNGDRRFISFFRPYIDDLDSVLYDHDIPAGAVCRNAHRAFSVIESRAVV